MRTKPIFESNGNAATSAAAELFKALEQGALIAAFAESCTGGLCASLITELPGSSTVFAGAVVSYSNAAKAELLGVSPQTLATYGAVSQETVAAMAKGATLRFHADCALAISGIAGPDGGSPEKPVGTVWIAWRGPGFACERRFRFEGDRASVRAAAATEAFLGLARLILGAPPDKLQA